MEIHESAFRHEIAVEDIRHAIEYAIEILDLDADSDPPKVLAIGPDRAGRGWRSSGCASSIGIS